MQIWYLISCSQDGKWKNREEEENHKKEIQRKKKAKKTKKGATKRGERIVISLQATVKVAVCRLYNKLRWE